MDVKSVLKTNKALRRIGKKINIYKQFRQDAHDFSKHYIESAEAQGDFRYSIMLLVHSLEKGMCMDKPRPFGFDKVKELMTILSLYPENGKQEFEYKLGISVLFSWVSFFVDHNWEKGSVYNNVKEFLSDKEKSSSIIAGAMVYKPSSINVDERTYENLFFSRRSVRDYQERKLDSEDIEFALKCFVETPTACNRQMCKLYYVTSPVVIELLNRVVIGLPGFNKKTIQYFVVTYDLASFAYSGERQQGLFNAGLCTMNFINGLHARGIGSCCLQWSNKQNQDLEVRSRMMLKDSERIGIVIGAGYYLPENTIPCSVRRDLSSVFRII